MTVDLVPTQLNYFSMPADGSKPWSNINADPKTGIRTKNYEIHEYDYQIENVRGSEDQYTLDSAGFQFFKAPTALRDFSDEEKIMSLYYDEQSELIKKLTGANRVVMFDHTIRRNIPGDLDDSPTNRHPVAIVHVDQTPASAAARVNRHLPASDAPSLLKKRFQIINLWRPISHYAIDRPLALCDWRSVDSSNLVARKQNGDAHVSSGDFVETTLRYPDHDGETFSVRLNANHKWKYQRGMELDEGVLIKCYDSIDDGSVARLTPHTSFEDPTTPKDAPLRESIELRALVFYEQLGGA